MPRKQASKLPSPKLTKPPGEVARIVQRQIDSGRELLALQIDTPSALEEAQDVHTKWYAKSQDYLALLFDNTSKLDDYTKPIPHAPVFVFGTPKEISLSEKVQGFKDWVRELVSRLENTLQYVQTIAELEGENRPVDNSSPQADLTSVRWTRRRIVDLLSQLREGLSSDQREMLNSIWCYHCEHGQWMSCRRLHSQFLGRRRVNEVRAALEDLGGSVLFETAEDCYALKLLGILLTDTGSYWEGLLARYLGFVRMKYVENPDIKEVSGREVQAAIHLPTEVSQMLGRVIALSHLYAGSFSGVGPRDWSAGVPQDVDTFPEWEDLGLYLRREALAGYDKTMPITQQGLMGYSARRIGPLPSDLANMEPSALAQPGAREVIRPAPRKATQGTVPITSGRNPPAAAFLSYTHFDDKHDQKQLTKLRERLAAEVRMQSGQPFEIFQDRSSILWGDQWEQRIEHTLGDEVTFLIPILTPSYFTSEPCRKELRLFLERERQLHRNDLIRPIYYVDCPVLNSKALQEKDDLVRVIASRQYADWRTLRFSALTSKAARTMLADLAVQIRDAIRASEDPTE